MTTAKRPRKTPRALDPTDGAEQFWSGYDAATGQQERRPDPSWAERRADEQAKVHRRKRPLR